MSYDLAFWADPTGRYAKDPQARYEALCELENDGYTSPELSAFLDELEARWPGGSDEGFENSPWASWPLRSSATPSGVAINLTYGAGLDAVEHIVTTSFKYGLVAYDPQGGNVFEPEVPLSARRRAAKAFNRRLDQAWEHSVFRVFVVIVCLFMLRTLLKGLG